MKNFKRERGELYYCGKKVEKKLDKMVFGTSYIYTTLSTNEIVSTGIRIEFDAINRRMYQTIINPYNIDWS